MVAARLKSTFVCQNCGAVSPRWQGKCDDCGGWNTLVEESASAGVAAGPVRSTRKGRVVALAPLAGESPEAPRVVTGIGEFDRVTGGGVVRGSTLLVGGDPGIGKSTLLLQVAGALALQGHRVVYISGEEAIAQIRLRAARLGLTDAPVLLAAETSVEDILATLGDGKVADPRHRQFDPDAVDRRGQLRAGDRDPGAGLGAGPDPLRQADRRRGDLRRPRHQGGTDRGPARRRAHGRRRALLRRRGRPSLPHPPRRQEPVRPDRRDRRVRDDGRRSRRGRRIRRSCSSASATSPPPARPSSPAWRGRGRSSSRSRRWSRRRRSARRGVR